MSITERVDAITHMQEQHRIPAPPCPKSVKIELTARCNLQCSFCATASNLRDKSDMDWEFYSQKLLPELRAAGVEEVGMFFLGESSILPWLDEAIAEAKRQGFPYVFLTTNGTALNYEKIESYLAAGLDSLKFSLNYADAEQFAEITRVKPALFQRLLMSIREAKEIRDGGDYTCGLYASYIDYDADQGRRMRALVDKVAPYLDEVYALPLYSQADLTGADSSDKGWAVRAGNPGRAGNMQEPVPCWSLFTEARVTHDGRLAACCFDHDGRFDMGNLLDENFMGAWHSDKFQRLRTEHLKGDVRGTACEHCVAYA